MIKLCELDEIDDPGSLGFEAYGIFLVRRGMQLFAYKNSCPHRRIALEWVENQFLDAEQRLIQCATHGALFRIDTGECIAGPCLGQRLQGVAVELKGSAVWADVAPS